MEFITFAESVKCRIISNHYQKEDQKKVFLGQKQSKKVMRKSKRKRRAGIGWRELEKYCPKCKLSYSWGYDKCKKCKKELKIRFKSENYFK